MLSKEKKLKSKHKSKRTLEKEQLEEALARFENEGGLAK